MVKNAPPNEKQLNRPILFKICCINLNNMLIKMINIENTRSI